MLELGRRLDLAQESIDAQECSDLWIEQLEGDLAFVAEVVGEVDSRHAPTPEFALDAVAVLQGVGNAIEHEGSTEGDAGICVRRSTVR